jgi:hypothetical protein
MESETNGESHHHGKKFIDLCLRTIFRLKEANLSDNECCEVVEEAFIISDRTVHRWLQAYVDDTQSSSRTEAIRASTFTDEQLQLMRDYYDIQPCLYAFEMRNILNSKYCSA